MSAKARPPSTFFFFSGFLVIPECLLFCMNFRIICRIHKIDCGVSTEVVLNL